MKGGELAPVGYTQSIPLNLQAHSPGRRSSCFNFLPSKDHELRRSDLNLTSPILLDHQTRSSARVQGRAGQSSANETEVLENQRKIPLTNSKTVNF